MPHGDQIVVPRKGLTNVALIMACGTALFSDGYINGVIGSVNTILKKLYPVETKLHNHATVFSSIGFAGIVVGQLTFGWLADLVGRKNGMFIANAIVFVFVALSAGAYGAGGSINGMLAALSAYRFLSGIGVGAEYPAGSVAAAENTEQPGIKKGRQQMWFALATNSAIDWGFVVAAFVPLVMLWIFGLDHLRVVWRFSLGMGCVAPLILFLLRLRIATEPALFQKSSMKNVDRMPWLLIFKRYWLRFTGIAVVWFIYDFISYPFGIYSSTVVDTIIGDTASLYVVFGWNVVINLFYIPGTMLGALILDWARPKTMLIVFLILQGITGFIMSGLYTQLSNHIAGFAVVYGLFLSFGEAGPGNCIGLLSVKSNPTAIRGRFYGSAAAIGKIGAYVGTWAFPAMIDAFGGADSTKGNTGPFWVGSGLAIFSAIVAFFFIPELTADGMAKEDIAFKEYLAEHGYDIDQFGARDQSAISKVEAGNLDLKEVNSEDMEITNDVDLKSA
ncbi:hypothetical protein CBS101457_002983 [Exobasidium rhododendri]|nr:hypothetical protein CBS101457_002983 [Exobasidium rhododendri]